MESDGATTIRTRVRARFAVLPASFPRRAGWRGRDAGAAIRDWLERELAERRGFNWLAVIFGAGAGAYFVLPREPLAAALIAATAVLALLAAIFYRRGRTLRPVLIAVMVFAGATAAKLRVDSLDTPVVARPFASELRGRVVQREDRVELRPRIVLDRLTTDADWIDELPPRVRLSLGEGHALPPLGAEIAVRARLMPVPGPVVPGGYDPRRAAYFDGIGGSGFVFGDWSLAGEPPAFAPGLAIERVRAAIVERILAAEPGEAGAVAAALLVGERSAISERTKEDLRASGLAHLLAISGLHMMLVAGTTFFLLRALLALSPGLALSYPIRKWAAAAALVTATLYLALSGGNVATIRAYVMAAVMFSAMLADRPAISMRNLAIAAFIVIATQPESVLEPGFQMSFAAVAALIAAWEASRDRRIRRLSDDSVLPGHRTVRLGWRAVLAVVLTTLVAGAATAPFAAYHFERVASYSLLGNLLAAPAVSLVVMPFGLLSLAAMPFGLEGLPLWVMARGIEALLAIAAWVAAIPGAELKAPPIAPAALLTIVIGMLWLCLWRERLRLLGVPAIVVGLGLIPLTAVRPSVMVAPEGTAVAVRDAGGMLRVSGSRSGSYTVEQFFDKEAVEPLTGAALREGVACDPLGCLLAGDGFRVAHVRDAAAFPEDCRRVDVVVTPLTAPADCAAALVIDAPQLQRFGAHAVRAEIEDGTVAFSVTTARSATPRPWEEGWRGASGD